MTDQPTQPRLTQPIRPERMRVVCVGVGGYDDAPGWDRASPALDACRFASHMVGRGVPPGQVTVFLTPAPGARTQAIPPEGAQHRPATWEEIHPFFVKELPRLEGDGLVVYWSGHGLDDGESQQLLFPDFANTGNTLRVTALLRWLRTDKFGYSSQILFVDACRQLMQHPLAQFPFPVNGELRQDLDQWAMQAVGTGEYAATGAMDETGAFTMALLAELDVSEAWPPDVPALRDALVTNADLPGPVTLQLTDPRSGRSRVVVSAPKASRGVEETADSATTTLAKVRHLLRQVPRLELPRNLRVLAWALKGAYEYNLDIAYQPSIAQIVDALDGMQGRWCKLRKVCLVREDIFNPRHEAVIDLLRFLDELCGGQAA